MHRPSDTSGSSVAVEIVELPVSNSCDNSTKEGSESKGNIQEDFKKGDIELTSTCLPRTSNHVRVILTVIVVEKFRKDMIEKGHEDPVDDDDDPDPLQSYCFPPYHRRDIYLRFSPILCAIIAIIVFALIPIMEEQPVCRCSFYFLVQTT